MDAFVVSTAKAQVESGTTSASFKISAVSSVPSDNALKKIPITTAALKAMPEYLTVPKKLAAGFLTSKVINRSESRCWPAP